MNLKGGNQSKKVFHFNSPAVLDIIAAAVFFFDSVSKSIVYYFYLELVNMGRISRKILHN